MTKLSLPALQKSTMRATRESSDTTIKSEKTSVNISMLQSSSEWLLPWWWRLKHRQKFFNIRLYQRPFLSIYAGVNCEAAALSVLVFPGVLANMVGRWSCTECSMLSFVRFHHECWGSTIPTWCRRKGVFRKWMWWNIFTVFVSP